MGPINYLPKETHLEIQKHLDKKSAVRYSRVCHEWNVLIGETDTLWKTLLPEITFPIEMKAKKYLDLHAIGSKQNFFERTEEFAIKIILGQERKFNCIFPYISNHSIELGLNIDPLIFEERSAKCLQNNVNLDFIFMKNVFEESIPNECTKYWGKSFSLNLKPLEIWPMIWPKDCVIEYSQLLDRIEIFANKLLLEQTGSFTCLIPNWPQCRFKLEMNYTGLQRFLKPLACTAVEENEIQEKHLDEFCVIVKDYKGYWTDFYSIKVEQRNTVYSISAGLPPFISSGETTKQINKIVKRALRSKGIDI